MSNPTTTVEEIRARYKFTRFAYEGDDPPQAQKDIDFLLAEIDRLNAENAAFGEFICRRCHLRQDSQPVSDPQF